MAQSGQSDRGRVCPLLDKSRQTRVLAGDGLSAFDPKRTFGTANTQLKMPTARDATSAMVTSEMAASDIMSNLALAVSGNVSAGENAVAFVNAKNR